MYVHKQWKLKNCVKCLEGLQQEMGTSRLGSVVSGAARRISLLSQPWGGALTTHRHVSVFPSDLPRAVGARLQEGPSWGWVSWGRAALLVPCEQEQDGKAGAASQRMCREGL